MIGDVTVTVIGNATGDAELRFTQSGAAVANFTVATNPRKKQGDQWVDGEPTFYRVNVWRQHAENVAESVFKGDRVIVVGTLQNRKYQTAEGDTRYSLEVTADAVGLDTKFAQARSRKVERQQAPQGGYQGGPPADPWGSAPPAQPQQGQRPPQAPPQEDLWGSAPRGPMGGGGFSDEPPF
jgi:single-strand DNA-binding protein